MKAPSPLASHRSKCGSKIKSIDQFGQAYRMKLNESEMKKFSFMGAMLTIMLFTMLLTFAISKLLAWKHKKDVDIMGAIVENAFDYTFKFGADKGFFVAAALTEYNSNTEVLEDSRYGELIFEHYGWGASD